MTAAGIALLLVAGVASGFVNTLAGGGSLLTLPALMLLGLPADVANGTNRLSIVTQGLTGATGFRREGRLEPGDVPWILAPTATGALIGAGIASVIAVPILEIVLTIVLIAMAALMAFAPGAVTGGEGERPVAVRDHPRAALGLFAAGLYGGFVQAGVGFLLLWVLGGLLRYDLVRANALKLVCTTAFGAVALVVFAWAGQVAWAPAVVLAVGTSIGSLLGVRFSVSVSPRTLRRAVLVLVVVACVAALAR